MLKRTIALTLLGAFSVGTRPAAAHHGYSQYDRCKSVVLEGTVESVAWENPHVLVMLKASDAVVYRVEWQALWQLANTGIDHQAVEPGDRLVVTGSMNRNPDVKIMTLVTEVRRSSDAWSWRDTRPRPSNCAG